MEEFKNQIFEISCLLIITTRAARSTRLGTFILQTDSKLSEPIPNGLSDTSNSDSLRFLMLPGKCINLFLASIKYFKLFKFPIP